MALPVQAHAADKSPNLGLFVSGPAMVLLALAPLAAVAAVLAIVGRLDSVVAAALGAQERLRRSWIIPVAWGLSASVLVIAASVVLLKTKVLALAAVALLAAGMILLGLGVAAGALSIGGRILEATGEYERPPLDHLRTGLWTLLVSAVCPLLGWLAAMVAAFAGIGAVLETIVTREK